MEAFITIMTNIKIKAVDIYHAEKVFQMNFILTILKIKERYFSLFGNNGKKRPICY